MKNLKISTRILGTFAILVALLLVVVAMALMQLRSMRESTQTITGNALPSVEVINVLNADLVRARLLELRHVNNDEPAYMADVEKQFEQLQHRGNHAHIIQIIRIGIIATGIKLGEQEDILATSPLIPRHRRFQRCNRFFAAHK